MSDEHRDLAAAAALGTLAPEESEGLEAALARDPALADELAAYRSTVSQLEAHLARETPSYDLFSGILAQLEPRTSTKAAAHPGRERRAWRGMLPAFAVGAAATAAVFALSLALDSSGGLGTPDAVASVQGTTDFAGVHGEARIYASDTPNGLLRLELADVPPAPEGEHYEVWVLRPSTGEAMEAVGVFDPTTSDVSLELGLPGAGDYAAVDISVEPDAGSPEHSGTSLAGGEFERGTT
jgi:anti-sigma-K factor RskA